MDDPIVRENRRSNLVRRLISHGVRTKIISLLTGLTRNRQSTVRKRLAVRDKSRLRGPTKSSLELFLKSSRARMEGAALAALCEVFDIPIGPDAVTLPSIVSLGFGERLCETFEAYRAVHSGTELALEELILLRSSLAKGDEIRSLRCRGCRALMLVSPYEGTRRLCPVCAPPED